MLFEFNDPFHGPRSIEDILVVNEQSRARQV